MWPNASGTGCLDDPRAFVCHLWNAMRLPQSSVQRMRHAAFAREIVARRPALRQLVAARRERYVNESTLLGLPRIASGP